MAKNGVEELLAVGQASQESSDACNAVLDCCLQKLSYSPPIYHPGYGLFCYSQDPSPPVFYNSDFEEYLNLQQCVIKPPCQASHPIEPGFTPVNIWSHECPSGVLSYVFMESVKACIATLLTITIREHMLSECYGCLCDTLDQSEHTCLELPPKPYLYMSFNKLMKALWNDRFLPGVMHVVKGLGLDVSSDRVMGACESFLYELRSFDNILKKRSEISDEFLCVDKANSTLLSDLVAFWNGKSV